MNLFFKSILSLSLSGALLIILMFLCKPLLRNRISKRWQYYMWVVVIVRLLVPFSLPMNIVNTLFQKIDNMMVQMTVISEDKDNHALQEGENTVVDYGSFQVNEGVPAMAHTFVPEKSVAVLQNLWLVWLIGALLLLIRKITIYQGFVKYVRAGCSEASDIDILNRLAQYEEQAGVKTPVELYINSLISSPLLIGFFKPCIVLPTADLSDADLRYTMLHELSHYKHWDMFYKWISQITLCLHWFNPFVYLMCNEISRACELACDETVISKLEAEEQEAYGDMLLNSIGIGGVYHDSTVSITLYENKEMIKERLGAIMNFKKKSTWITLMSAALVISLAAVSAVIGAYAAPSIAEDESAAYTASSIAEDESAAYIAPSITEDESAAYATSSIAEDEQAESGVTTIIDNMVSDHADINIILDKGVYYILGKGVDGIGEHSAGVTDGNIMFVLIRADESFSSVGPFEISDRLVDEVAEQCNYMLGRNSKSISREEANLLIEIAAKIQSGDDSIFADLNAGGSRVEEYKELGIEKKDNAYYYENERVSILYDLGADGSMRMNYDADGSINIRLLRDGSGAVVKVEYLTAREVSEILREFNMQ